MKCVERNAVKERFVLDWHYHSIDYAYLKLLSKLRKIPRSSVNSDFIMSSENIFDI